jgi:hypothetical protein
MFSSIERPEDMGSENNDFMAAGLENNENYQLSETKHEMKSKLRIPSLESDTKSEKLVPDCAEI